MLETYITPILMSYVDKYIKNLKPSDLNLSLWGGDVSLTNLELNLHALEKELSFPVTFLSGKIHELHMHVPWTKLYYEPAVITINTIECVLKLKENNFTAEGVDEAIEVQQADIKPSSDSTTPEPDTEKAIPPGYVQSLLNKVIYNLTVKVNNFILKYVEDDIVLSINVKSAEFHSANENWVKAFVDVTAPDWILHKMCNISDLTVCLDRRNASGVIEMYQDPLAYRCNLSCRMQIYYDKEGFHLPLEKNLSVYCECLEVSITDQQLPLLLRLLKLGLGLYYGTLDLPGCEPLPHIAKDLIDKKGEMFESSIMNQLPSSFGPPAETELPDTGWLSWAYSMVPGLGGEQKGPDASLTPLVSRFGVYISQASLSFKITEPLSEGNFLGAQRFVFKPILTLEASGVAQEMITKGSSFFDFEMGVTSVTGWLVDTCVCRNRNKEPNADDDGNAREPEEELFLKVGGKDTNADKGIAFLKGSLFDLESSSTEQPQLTANAEEFSRKNAEANVLSRFGAMFFEYLYVMEIENNDDSSYYESTPAVKEESHQRIIVGPSTLEVTSGVVHRMEMVIKLAEDDAYLRKEKDEIFYDDFVQDQLLSGNVSQRHLHVTVLDSSFIIFMADHVKTAQTQNESTRPSEGTLDEIQEEEKKSSARHLAPTTGCVLQVERLDFQKTSPMFPAEMIKLLKEKKGTKALLKHAHSNMFVKVFGFQIGVSKHDVDVEDPMILNIVPACNMSLFAKQSLVSRQLDDVDEIEARFELASLSLNITKPQLVLLRDIHQSWMNNTFIIQNGLSGSSLIQDVFHPSAKQGGKIPVLIEAFIQDIKVQLHMTPEEISSSGSVASVKATVMSLSGETAESTPVLYGPLITADIYSGNCFKDNEKKSFKMETLEPWLAFTVKIPLVGQDGNLEALANRPQTGGAILLKCNGTVINLDPVLFTWLAYYPRMSPTVDTSSRGKQLRKVISHTRSVSGVTPRRKSYARGYISPSHPHKKQKKLRYSQQRKRCDSIQESRSQDFDGWVWERLPLLASVVIQVDVESVVFFAPSAHLAYDDLPGDCYDIPGNFIRQVTKRDSTPEPLSGLVLSLPLLKIRSSGHQDLAICHDILRHPLTLPPRDQPETLPWTLTADHASVFTVWTQGDGKDAEVYFLINPTCCRAMLASAKTSHPGNTIDQNKAHKATLDFVLHTDFNPLTINCSKKQVDLLFQLYSNAVQLTSSVSPSSPSNENEPLLPARSVTSTVTGTGRSVRRTASITSSSGFDVIDDESMSSESTPKPSVTSLDTPKVSPSLIHVSLWVQWTLPKLSFNIFGNDNGSDLRITTELEDWSASFDYQNGHFKTLCKLGNFSITHYKLGCSGQWTAGSGGGTILARQDSLSSSLSKVRDGDSDSSDPGPHGFLYVEYTASSLAAPSFKAAFELDDVFRNSFAYSQDVHVTIQPFDFILWCPLLYTVRTVFHTFTSLQSDSAEMCESSGVPVQDSSGETYQRLTNLPVVNLKLRGFRIIVPSSVDEGKFKTEPNSAKNSDLFTIQAALLLVSSQLENPIPRLVVDKKLSKALAASARNRRGSAAEKGFGDTQYRVEVKGLRFWSGCWNELCRMLPNQDATRIERDLLEQNPALEWNTYNGQDRTSALVIPMVSDMDIKGIIAPPIYLTTSSNSQSWSKPIFGLSLEVNLTTDVECFFSKSQVLLMQTILKDNIFNSGFSNDDFIGGVTGNEDPASTLSHPSEVAKSQEKLDSGIGSECSHGNRLKHVVQSRESTPDVQEMECLFTAGGVSVFVYEHSPTGEAGSRVVPVVGVSLVQPSFNCTRRTDCNTIQISCFDVSLAKCESNSRNSDDIQLVPSSENYDVIWFRTGDGSPDKRTELSPSFANFTCKLYQSSPADLKLDFGRPIWIDIDLGLLERLKNFATDLNSQGTTPDGVHESGSESEVINIARSVAVSTDYVAITATAGHVRGVDPAIKASCSSMNLGVSLKADDREDFCQRIAANLHLCALSMSAGIDDKFRSFLLPYDASIDMELFCNSPAVSQDTCCVSAVKEVFIWLDSGLLQVNFGQEHLRCIEVFSENVMTFINTNFEKITDNADPLRPNPAPTVHRSEDDLRTGPFKYVTSTASETRPNPYEIVFSDEGLPTMTWRYSEPRALCSVYIIPVPFTTFTSYPSPVKEEDRILPCILRYWDNIQKCYLEHSTFDISENVSVIVPMMDPTEGPLTELIAAAEWQVVANIAMTNDDDEICSDDEYSVLSERSNIPSPISATSLAACMKVDSMFSSNLVPKLSIAATVNIIQFTVYNHMENIQNAISKKFEGYTLQEEIPKSQEFFRVMVENSTIIMKSWPTDTLQCLVWSNAHADVLDYRELRWKSLLSPVDLTLAFVKNEITQRGNKTKENSGACSLDVSCGDITVDASQSRIHTLSAGLLAWQNGEDHVFSHFIICNNTNHAVRFGQDGTEESILLRSKHVAFYSWTTLNDLCHQKLHLSLDGESRWCEPFGIDSPGVLNRAIQYSVHTATLIIEIKKKSGLQREVVIHSSHVVRNYTIHDIEVQLLQNPAVTQVTSPALQVLHNIIVHSQSSSPSYVISHGGLAGMRVRLRGETTWSGTLPIEDQMPNYKQHCVVQMLGTKEFKNFYIWYNAVCVDSLIGQIEISFSPLFIVKNYLSQTIQLAAVSTSGDATTTHDVPGKAQEHQLFDLPPDSWHYVTFKLPDAKISSDPSVPLNTTLHELTDKVKQGDESEELSKAQWPYSSSNFRKTSADPYMKPVESTLVRHVQSSQDDSQQLEKESNKSDLSCVELQCQILNKWKKLRSILLEVKPWALFENKSCVTLHLKDETGKSVFDLKSGQVISPTKLKLFRVGVIPKWLDEIRWSVSISLVDGDHPQTPASKNSLQQYGQLKCLVVVPSPSGRKLCSLLLTSHIAKGIRIVTLQESTRIVYTTVPRPLFVQPVIVNDVTTKLKETAFSANTRISLETGKAIVPQGIPFWDISPETSTPDNPAVDSIHVLIFGLSKPPDIPDASPSIQWSRPLRIQDGIVRQCLSLETSDQDQPLPVVVITLIENSLTKVVITEDQVPRMLLTNHCTTPIQFGQCPSNSDKQNSKGSKISGRDLAVSENLEQYTTIPRLGSNSSVYYEPPEMRDGFLTKNSQKVPKIRVQMLKPAEVREVLSDKQDETRAKPIYMPQGWSEAIDVNSVGKTAYNLPGNCRLHVNVVRKTSFLTQVVFSETFSEAEDSTPVQVVDNVKVNCNVSNFSVCLHDESSWIHTTAVFHLNLEDLAISAIRSDNLRTHIELSLAEIQIDNQMSDDFYHFPVVLLPLEHESRSTKRKEKRTIKSVLCFNLDFSSSVQKTHVHVLSIQLEPLSVFVEDTLLYRLAGMLDSFVLPGSDRPTEPCGEGRIYSRQSDENLTEGQAVADSARSLSEDSTISDEDIQALALASAVISPVLIDRISIEPIYVAVTFHASVKLFVSANHTPLFFSRFEMTSLFTDPAFLAQLLAVHYGYSALLKVGWVVGSLDIIGSPATFLRSFGQGVADFFYLPYDGLTRGPTAFVTGMTRGMSSFMSHISAGALTSVTNLASSVSRNLDRLSFDEQYVRFQEQERADGVPRRVISGFTHGLSGFLLSVLGAVAGVADQPLQGVLRAENARDATSGLITGVGKGLIGVVTKPLGGAMEMVSQTGQGILQGTGLGEMPSRLCEREDTLGSSCHLKYLWKLLESKSSSDLFCVTVSVVVSGNSHFDATLVMSCDSLMFLDTDDDTVLSAFVLKQVDMREDPQHPRAIIVEHSVAGADSISEASSFAELSPSNIGASRDVTSRGSRQSFSENEAVHLTLFMDPVYLRPLLSRFKLFKSGY